MGEISYLQLIRFHHSLYKSTQIYVPVGVESFLLAAHVQWFLNDPTSSLPLLYV